MSRIKRQRLDVDGHDRATLRNAGDVIDEDHVHKEDAASALKADQPKQLQHRSLFVRALPRTVTTDALVDLFSQKYPVKHATVVVDPVTKDSKGYGFVTLADSQDTLNAIEDLQDSIVDGGKIRIEIAEPRHRRNSGTLPQSTAQITKGARGGPKESSTRDQGPSIGSRLIVRNLPWTFREDDQLASLFRSYGKIIQVSIPKRGPRMSPGFGFVLLRGRKNAEKALDGVNGKVIEGRTLAVDWAVDKSTWETSKSHQAANSQGEPAQSPSSTGPVEGDVEKQHTESLDSDNSLDGISVASADFEKDDSSTHTDIEDEDAMDIEKRTEARVDTGTNVFVRNLPFSATDDSLFSQFQGFGAIKYARVVVDQVTGVSKGTGFVSFFNQQDMNNCIRGAPRSRFDAKRNEISGQGGNARSNNHSLLEDTNLDPSGRYTMEGRVLQVSAAVSRTEAARLSVASHSQREAREKDKRRLFLLSEGAPSSDSVTRTKMSPTEIRMREESLKQRQAMVKSNPSLHLSLTRLSIRNLPRAFSSKALKALAREAVVGYAKDVKAGVQKPLNKEEICRGGEAMREAERNRKAKGVGIVKQSKIIFEGKEGGKVSENSGGGRSRGYGFVEYSSHRWALMGLRWLNGHLARSTDDANNLPGPKDQRPSSGKHLIAEFALENAQVLARRREQEFKARSTAQARRGRQEANTDETRSRTGTETGKSRTRGTSGKQAARQSDAASQQPKGSESGKPSSEGGQEKSANRQRIIGRKRMARKNKSRAKK